LADTEIDELCARIYLVEMTVVWVIFVHWGDGWPVVVFDMGYWGTLFPAVRIKGPFAFLQTMEIA